jgi:fatty acid desaturase
VAVWIGNPLVWLVVLVLLGSFHARVAILGHEAAHRLLFPNKRLNDFVGKWLLSYPGFVPFDLYRRSHFAHHKEEFGPNEPDLNLYNGYPITRASFRRKLTRDAYGNSGWKNLKGLLRSVRSAQPVALRIVAAQVVLLLVCTLFGRPELYLLWIGSWMTSWRVLNRLRSIAEHGGMTRSPDRRLTTHSVRQTWLARFWIVPYNTGWHLAHHVDMGVPWRNLPALHRELVASGWVTPDLEYPSYTALWRKLASRETVPAPETVPA